jgi:hypothetical protein
MPSCGQQGMQSESQAVALSSVQAVALSPVVLLRGRN